MMLEEGTTSNEEEKLTTSSSIGEDARSLRMASESTTEAAATTGRFSLQTRLKSSRSCLVHLTQESSIRSSFRASTRSIATVSTAKSSSCSSSVSFKKVSWDCVAIYDHAMILGDNPSVSWGVPVTIEWAPYHHVILPIDDYEKGRLQLRREKNELVLQCALREDIVRAAGSPRSEMREVCAVVKHVQKQRQQSAHDGALLRSLSFHAYRRRRRREQPQQQVEKTKSRRNTTSTDSTEMKPKIRIPDASSSKLSGWRRKGQP